MEDGMFVVKDKTLIAGKEVPLFFADDPRWNTAGLVALERAATEGTVHP